MLKAVILDLDGVIADSHPLHHEAWKTLFAEQGLHLTDPELGFILAGHPRAAIIRHYLGELPPAAVESIGRRKDELYAAIAHRLQPVQGLRALLDELEAAGIAKAVATSAAPERTAQTLKAFGMERRFSAVLVGGVTHPKPAPDIFLLAARKLHVQPAECLVIEDSVAGVQAAKAAAMLCVGYAAPERAADLRVAGADLVIDKFTPGLVMRFAALFETARLMSAATRSH